MQNIRTTIRSIIFYLFIGLTSIAFSVQSANTNQFDIAAATKIVEVNGENFPVIDYGEGPVVLMLHGWPDSKEVWRFQIPKIAAAGYRVIAPDLRGFGDAPRQLEVDRYSFFLQIGDINGLLDALGVQTASLVGHDFGAALSWTLARFVPQRFDTLVAISNGSPTATNPGFRQIPQREKLWYNYLFLQTGIAEFELSANNWQFLRNFTEHPDIEDVIAKLSRPDALTASLNWYRGNLQSLLAPTDGVFPPPPPPQPNVTQPVLGIWGKKDNFLLREQMEFSSAEVDNEFTFKVLKKAGHWLMLEKPKKTSRLIIKFLDCNVKNICD